MMMIRGWKRCLMTMTTISKDCVVDRMADYRWDNYSKRDDLAKFRNTKPFGVSDVGNINGNTIKINVDNNHVHTPVEFKVFVVSLDDGYPHGLYCTSCNVKFEDGDVVLAGQQRLVGWVGWHTRCLKGILEEAPMDEYEVIKQRLDNGEDLFE
jgi:hypothetical protein